MATVSYYAMPDAATQAASWSDQTDASSGAVVWQRVGKVFREWHRNDLRSGLEDDIVSGSVPVVPDNRSGLKYVVNVLINSGIKEDRQIGPALQLRGELLRGGDVLTDGHALPNRLRAGRHSSSDPLHDPGSPRGLSYRSLNSQRLMSSGVPCFGCLSLHEIGLSFDGAERPNCGVYASPANEHEDRSKKPTEFVHPIFLDIGADIERFDRRYGYWIVALFLLSSAPLGVWGGDRIGRKGRRDLFGWLLLSTAATFWISALVSGLIGRLPWDWWNGNEQEKTYHSSEWQGLNVSQKLLPSRRFSYYNNYMANILSADKQIAIIASLCEGSSIRSIERITGVHRDTIMRLGVRVGHGCAALMDEKMRNLSCNRLEMDEIWGFIGKKEKRVRPFDDPSMGDVWTFCAIDADTKLVPAFKVGKRDNATATAFVGDISGRMKNRVQISTDGLRAYVDAIEKAFGANVDYAQIIKTYGHEEVSNNRRYSAPEFVSSEKKIIAGTPDYDL